MIKGYACDRCGEDITTGRTVLTIESGPLRAAYQTRDMCPVCAGKLAEFLKPTAVDDDPATIAPKQLTMANGSA